VNVKNIQTVWQTNMVARTIMVLTFGSTLVMPLQYAVLLGVMISILLFVFQQSNTVKVVEWVTQPNGWPIERPAPKQLESGKATFLYVYGNLFFAAASLLEKTLPDVEGSFRAVVILLVRGNDDVGSTVNEVFRRYAESLHNHSGKLILAGVSPALHNQLERTGLIALIGPENIIPATDSIGEAGNAAFQAANDWLAQFSAEQDATR
jgi:SulP family sulfate permease